MKRFISILIVSIFSLFCLVACQSRSEEDKPIQHKLKVVTTIFPQYDFARQIAGDKAEVAMLLKPGMESHSYEPTPQDIKLIQNSDLFIYTGGENDVWIEEILSSMGDKKPATLKLLDIVPTVKEEVVKGMEHNHDDDEDEPDEHVWTSPKNAMAIVNSIAAKMSEKDPENAKTYETNRENYILQLKSLDTAFRDVVKNAKRKTILFGDRFPFRYFADEYGLRYYAAFSGCSTETEASAATIAFLINRVKQEHLPVVFTIEFSNGKIADSISDATGAKKVTLFSNHNISRDQLEAGETFLSLMNKNVESLNTALN